MKEKTYLTKRLILLLGLVYLWASPNIFGQCPAQYAIDGVVWFGTSANAADYDTSQPLGSFDNPLVDWNSGTPSVLEAITDCAGPITIEFRECYYDTDGTNGDINWVQENLNDNVTINGNGALLVNMSASSAWLRLCERDNWNINDMTLTGWNGTDGGAIQVSASTNVTLTNVIFDNNPTTTPLHIDVGDNFVCGYGNTSVVLNGCVFSNNPPVSETVSTGGMEIEHTAGSGNWTLDVEINDTRFSCNARQGFGGGLAVLNPNDMTLNLTINGGSFDGNHGDANSGDGGAIYVDGENTTFIVDGTVFTCNDSEGSVGNAGGGAIRIFDGPTSTITNAVFYNNSVGGLGGYGGAINFGTVGPTGSLTISNTVFVSNASERGGALYLEGGTTTTCTDCLFLNNSTTGGGTGGAVFLDGGAAFTTTNTTFTGNSPDDVNAAYTDNGGSSTLSDPGITACPACFAVPPPGCDASTSDLALSCTFFCSTGTPPNGTGDADLTIDMSNFTAPTCTDPLDYTYVFLVVDAAGNVVCEFPATDADTQDPNGTPAYTTTTVGTPDGIPDAMDPAVQQANLCAGLTQGDYQIVGFHYLTADVPPIVTPFIGQTLATIQGYLTNPPTDPVACGVIGTPTDFTVLEPIVVTIATSCPAVPDGTYLADITVTGGYPLEAGAGTYTLTTNFGVTSYTFGTPITGQAIPAGQTVDVTVTADGNGANGTNPPGPFCMDCMATIVSQPEEICQACPDIVDGSLNATVNAAPVTDICSGDAVDVCVTVDLTNDATATVEFSNDGGTTWTAGTATSATEFCATFTETNTTCDAVSVSYMAQFDVNSLADNTCSLDTQPIIGGAAVTVNVYPDVATVANAMLMNDGACGPSLTQACANFTITNTYDANGETPDFSTEMGMGSFDFVITNAAAPTACQTTTIPATYNCVVNTPELTITKANDPTGIVSIGDTITYTVTVTNIGTGDATNVILTDAAPANTTLIVGSLTETTALAATLNEATPNVSATLGTLAPNGVVTISFQVTVDAGTADGTIIPNVASVDSDETDPEDSPEVTNVVELPELDIVKSNDPQGLVAIGDVITYTIVVTNNGTGDAHNVSITDVAPTNTTLVAGSLMETTAIGATLTEAAPNVTADQFDLAGGGESMTISFQVTVNAGTPGGTLILNTATVDSDETEPEDSNEVDNEVEDPFPSINMDKDDADNTDDMQTVMMGGDATFTITVTNDGEEDLCNVAVTDPNGLMCEMTYTDNGGVLVVGDTWTYTCTVSGVTAGFVNTATVNAIGCTSGTPVDDDDPSTVFVPEADIPSIAVDKNDADNGDDAQTINSGGDATFTITVTNDGEEDLCNVSVTDPNGLMCEMTYTDNGGVLAIGETWTYVCTVSSVTASFVNTATVNAMGCNSGIPVEDEDPSCVTVEDPVLDAVKTSEFTDANGDGLLNPGEIISYAIILTNYGTADALNVMFSDAVPIGTTLLGNETTSLGSISSGTDPITANIGTLAANGGTVTITFDVTVDANTADGFIIMNQGTFTADNHPDVPTDDPTTPTTPEDPTTDPVSDPTCTDADNGTWNH